MARIEALSAEVGLLRDEVVALRSASSTGRAPDPAPDVSVPAQDLGTSEPTVAPAPVIDPATPEELLFELFTAAAMADSEAGFERFTLLMHPAALDGPRALSSLRAFQWKQLRKNHREYLDASGRCDTFQITDRRPPVVSPRDATCKLFIRSSRRLPVPLQLRRLDDDPSRWRVEVCSL